MTKRDKFIMFCSIAIALCLIFGIVYTSGISGSNSKLLSYSVPIIIISLLAVFGYSGAAEPPVRRRLSHLTGTG